MLMKPCPKTVTTRDSLTIANAGNVENNFELATALRRTREVVDKIPSVATATVKLPTESREGTHWSRLTLMT
jgi:hypothetical protein